MIKRFYEACFYFDCGAAIACIVVAHRFELPALLTCSLWFAGSAVLFWFALRRLR